MTTENLNTAFDSKEAEKGLAVIAQELRKSIEKSDADYQAKLEKVEKDFNKFEDVNQKLMAQVQEQKKASESQAEVIAALEKHVAVNKNGKNVAGQKIDSNLAYIFEKNLTVANDGLANLKGDKTYVEKMAAVVSGVHMPELKSVAQYLKLPEDKAVSLEFQKKYLQTAVSDQGGLLCPPEVSLTILKRGTEWSPIRNYANVMQTYSNQLLIPVRNTLTQAFWEWEATPSVNSNSVSNSQYNQRSVHMKRIGVKTKITQEMILYSPFDIQSLVTQDVAEAFAKTEGSAFINGAGSANQPAVVEGLLSNSDVISYAGSSAVKPSADDILNMQAAIKWEIYGQPEYSRMYLMNKRTLIKLLTLKSGIGTYLWNPGALGSGIPSTLAEENYVICPDMPDIGAGAKPIIMGDLKRAYTIVDRLQMYMVRDDVTDPPNIVLSFFKFLGAKVIMPEALVVLTQPSS